MKILLAVDGSSYSMGAARFLTLLDLSPDDEITVFYALHSGHFLFSEKSYRAVINELKKISVPGILDSALEVLKPVKARVSTAVAEGPVKETIMKKAAEARMDLIIMGAKGVTGVESLFLGSVTRAVAAKSTVSVLVTKLPLNTRPGGMKILFATDGSEYSISTQEVLASMPFPGGSEIAVLNVTQTIFSDMYIHPALSPQTNEDFIEIIEKARASGRMESGRIIEQARDYLGHRFGNVTVLSAEGDPSSVILDTAEGMKADLIAVGCRGLTGISGMIGSVSRTVLSDSKSSVLIGKMCGD